MYEGGGKPLPCTRCRREEGSPDPHRGDPENLQFLFYKESANSSLLGLLKTRSILTINEPVDYMAWAVMILMRVKDITWAIGMVG